MNKEPICWDTLKKDKEERLAAAEPLTEQGGKFVPAKNTKSFWRQ